MRITAVTTSLPGPRKPRLLGFVRVLREAGHDVSVVATTDHSHGGAGPEAADRARLAELGVPVTQLEYRFGARERARGVGDVVRRRATTDVAVYRSAGLAIRAGEAVDATRPDVLHVERTRALELVRAHPVPKVVDVIDPRGIAAGQYRAQGMLALQTSWREVVRAMVDRGPAAREEGPALADLPVLVASELGRRALIDLGLPSDFVTDVPNPVSADERAVPIALETGAPPLVGMSGNLSYPPNVLGFERFASEVLPSLQRELSARFVLIGAKPHARVRSAAARAGVELYIDVASVPRAIRDRGVGVMVSPQGVSTGFPNRVVDAVYRAGVPIICSPETAHGAPGRLGAALPLASTPAQWVAGIRSSTEPGSTARVAALQAEIEATCGAEAVLAALVTAYARAVA